MVVVLLLVSEKSRISDAKHDKHGDHYNSVTAKLQNWTSIWLFQQNVKYRYNFFKGRKAIRMFAFLLSMKCKFVIYLYKYFLNWTSSHYLIMRSHYFVLWWCSWAAGADQHDQVFKLDWRGFQVCITLLLFPVILYINLSTVK